MVAPTNGRTRDDESRGIERPGEERMWICVIMQALEDATVKLPSDAPTGKRVMRAQAREWLAKPSRDLEQVCALANVEMQRVIAFAKARIEQADNGTVPRLKGKPVGGGSQLRPDAQGPAVPHRARSSKNRVSESKEAA